MSQNQTTGTTVAITTPNLDIIDGQITTTSNQVAQHFNKRHTHVLRAIKNLLKELPEEHQPNFGLMFNEVIGANGATRKEPAYRITRDGFALLAMGFTGKEALQWKVAYISAFNKMEAELLKQQAPAQRPYNPAIDYDRISPAQAQDIKELVQMIVDAGVQGYGETYNRLHRKFRVNSYLELPATRYDEVCMYLRAKFPKDYCAQAPQQMALPDESIDVAALLLSGQCDPKPLTPAVQSLIDQAAGRLVGEAYPLIRAHLERRVSWNTNQAQRQSGDTEVAQQVLGAVTLGNCLAHHLHSEAQSVRMLLQAMRQRLDAVLGSHEQQLSLATAQAQRPAAVAPLANSF